MDTDKREIMTCLGDLYFRLYQQEQLLQQYSQLIEGLRQNVSILREENDKLKNGPKD